MPIVEPTASYPVVPSTPTQFEETLERGWQRLRRWLTLGATAFAGAVLALLVVAAVVAPLDRDHSFLEATFRAAARLWFVALVYSVVLVPVARVGLDATGNARRAVRRLVVERGYWRRLVTYGIGAPIVVFAVLEPTTALIVLALVVLHVLGLGF